MKSYVVSNTHGLNLLREQWNTLAGDVPFRAHEWLATWWTHYGSQPMRHRELHVVCVANDAGRLVGLAPWYLDRSLAKGRMVRWLGDGEVCTDHLTLFCEAEYRSEVAAALAQHLIRELLDWDLLELEGVDSGDLAVAAFMDELRKRGCLVQRRPMESCWAVLLPETWTVFLEMQSKSHRKQLERVIRGSVDAGRGVWHRVTNADGFAQAWPMLIDLHQRRWQSVGQPGAFASQAFRDFHSDVAPRMLTRGQLRLSWLELDGVPIAAEYHLGNSSTTYVYQGGLDPERLDEQPGRILKALTIRDAIESGQTTYDFLRGDEPYKAQWRAQPQATFRLRVVPRHRTARVRAQAFDAARQMKALLRRSGNWLLGVGAGTDETR